MFAGKLFKKNNKLFIGQYFIPMLLKVGEKENDSTGFHAVCLKREKSENVCCIYYYGF